MTKKEHSRRQKILQAAIEVFGNSNFQNAYISKIAKKANVAESTIYHYFKNKEDIFFTLVAQKMDLFCEDMNYQLREIHGALDKLRKFTWLYLYYFKINPTYARTLMLELHVNKNLLKSQTFKRMKAVMDRVLRLINEGQEEGLIRNDMDGHVIRDLLMGILEHRVTRWVLKEGKYDLLENYGRICDFALVGRLK